MLDLKKIRQDAEYIVDYIEQESDDLPDLFKALNQENVAGAAFIVSNADDLADMAEHYKVCALWSSIDEGDEDGDENEGGTTLDENYSSEDFDDESSHQILVECAVFLLQTFEYIDQTNATYEQHGHDLWLTRNGHGAGFWDRGYGDVGEKLTEAAKAMGEVYIFSNGDTVSHNH